MNRKTSQWLVFASTLAVYAFTSMAAAHDGDRHGRELDQLNLTNTQRASIQQIETTGDAQNAALRQAVQKQRQAFDAMTPNQAGYQAAAANLARAQANETQARVMERAQVSAQIYSLLTPAQQTQLAQLKAARAAHESEREQSKATPPQP